jgi:hypothetical protein
MNRFKILKLPFNFIPCYAPIEKQEEELILQGRRIQVPLFEITSNPTIPITEIRDRRFNLIERAQEQASQQIAGEIDRTILQELDSFASSSGPVERLQITTNRRLGLNTTDPYQPLIINQS